MENKNLGFENEAELEELSATDTEEAGGSVSAAISVITSITGLITKVVCPSGACTSACK